MKVRAVFAAVLGSAALAGVTSVTLSSQLPPVTPPELKLPEREADRLRARVPFSAMVTITDFKRRANRRC